MRDIMKRLFIVSCVCFFPLALAGRAKIKTSPRTALRYYRAAILIFIVFLVFLALYTFVRGGNFIKPMGTFY